MTTPALNDGGLGEGTLGGGTLGFALRRVPVEIQPVADFIRMDVSILKPIFRAEVLSAIQVQSVVDRVAIVLTEVVEVI